MQQQVRQRGRGGGHCKSSSPVRDPAARSWTSNAARIERASRNAAAAAGASGVGGVKQGRCRLKPGQCTSVGKGLLLVQAPIFGWLRRLARHRSNLKEPSVPPHDPGVPFVLCYSLSCVVSVHFWWLLVAFGAFWCPSRVPCASEEEIRADPARRGLQDHA